MLTLLLTITLSHHDITFFFNEKSPVILNLLSFIHIIPNNINYATEFHEKTFAPNTLNDLKHILNTDEKLSYIWDIWNCLANLRKICRYLKVYPGKQYILWLYLYIIYQYCMEHRCTITLFFWCILWLFWRRLLIICRIVPHYVCCRKHDVPSS